MHPPNHQRNFEIMDYKSLLLLSLCRNIRRYWKTPDRLYFLLGSTTLHMYLHHRRYMPQ